MSEIEWPPNGNEPHRFGPESDAVKARKMAALERAKGCRTCDGRSYVVYDDGFKPYAVACPTCQTN